MVRIEKGWDVGSLKEGLPSVSSINVGIGAMNAAASFAGAQRTEADTDRNKEVAGERKFQVDRAAALARTEGDVADPDLSTDRDADGRLSYGQPLPPEEDDIGTIGESTDPLRGGSRCQDAFGERGNTLDVEA